VFLPYSSDGKSVVSVPSFTLAVTDVDSWYDLKNQQLTKLDFTVSRQSDLGVYVPHRDGGTGIESERLRTLN